MFNIVYHLHQQYDQVERWTPKQRKLRWELYLEQKKFEESQLD